MTAQAYEKIYIDGQEQYMATEPLKSYLSTLAEREVFSPIETSCWRGYHGTWEIIDNKLFLIDLKGHNVNYERGTHWKVGLDYLFPNQNKVFAEWFTGEIRISSGVKLSYFPVPKYEFDLFLEFKDGMLIGRRKVDNIIEEFTKIINRDRKTVSQNHKIPLFRRWFNKIISVVTKRKH